MILYLFHLYVYHIISFLNVHIICVLVICVLYMICFIHFICMYIISFLNVYIISYNMYMFIVPIKRNASWAIFFSFSTNMHISSQLTYSHWHNNCCNTMQWIIFELDLFYWITNGHSQHAYFITIDIQQTDKLLTYNVLLTLLHVSIGGPYLTWAVFDGPYSTRAVIHGIRDTWTDTTFQFSKRKIQDSRHIWYR